MIVGLSLLFVFARLSDGLNNGLGRTPQMGKLTLNTSWKGNDTTLYDIIKILNVIDIFRRLITKIMTSIIANPAFSSIKLPYFFLLFLNI